ncbi:cytochrome c biogenesis protein [Candidatus Magnetomoraceae bacterium gMMP-1]
MKNQKPANKILKFFSSVKLSVILLFTLAVTSIIGTVIPQHGNPFFYVQKYGEGLSRVFYALGFFDMYHSWWFQFILILLTINIVICSLERFAISRKIVFIKKPVFRPAKFRNLKEREGFIVKKSPIKLRESYGPLVAKNFRYCELKSTDDGFCIYGEKGRWTRLGVYAVHLSILLMIFGGLAGSMFGFEGYVNIPEGDSVTSVRIKQTNKIQHLDFKIKCDNFNVSFYETGAPKEYRSDLTIIENEKTVLERSIVVNDPLRYKGINIFQSSYGTMPPREAPEKLVLLFQNVETKMTYEIKAEFKKETYLPEGKGKFILTDYKNSFNFAGRNLGPAFYLELKKRAEDESQVVRLPVEFYHFDRMRKGDFVISVSDYEKIYYTGLQITKDPGIWLVYSGFIIMIIGILITFFMSHQRVCVEVISERKNKTSVSVAGTATKNKVGIHNKVKKIVRDLKRIN